MTDLDESMFVETDLNTEKVSRNKHLSSTIVIKMKIDVITFGLLKIHVNFEEGHVNQMI